MTTLRCWLALVLATAVAPAAAQWSITLFAGYAGSNGVDNVTANTDADVKNAATFGATLGMPYDAARELQLQYSQQSTTLSPGGGAAPFDLTIRHLHIGGTAFIDGPVGQGFYAVGGVGITQFRPGSGGYGSEVKPSFNIGFGYLLPLGQHVAVRAEARGILALVNSSGGFLCTGGCIAVLKSDAFTQLEARLGLMARF
jgi:hypothetical protein